MKQDIKEEWIKALESGKYEQTKGTLRKSRFLRKPLFCATGILCDLARKRGIISLEKYKELGVVPSEVRIWAGVDYPTLSGIVNMNDTQQKSFKEIAVKIRETL